MMLQSPGKLMGKIVLGLLVVGGRCWYWVPAKAGGSGVACGRGGSSVSSWRVGSLPRSWQAHWSCGSASSGIASNVSRRALPRRGPAGNGRGAQPTAA